MFKKIKTQFILLLSISILAISCYDDEGNYDYKDINEVGISGLEEKYSVARFENFNLVPELTYSQASGNTANYTYKWQAYQRSGVGDDRVTDLSNEKDLLVPIELIPGNYTVYYTVYDDSTGLEWQYDFDLEVANSIYEGWLVLNDINGASRLDMISYIYEEYQTKHDVLALAGSELTLDGAPGFVYCYSFDPSFYGIYVSTSGNGTVKLEPNTFTWKEAFNISNEFTTNQPIDLEVDNLVAKTGGEAYVAKDGNIYWYYRLWNRRYSAPVNSIDGVVFEASPLIGSGNYWDAAVLYDNTNKRFVRAQYGSAFLMPEGTLFDYNTGKDLLYIVGSDYNSSYGDETFAVLNDPVDNKRYLAVFTANEGIQSHYGEIVGPDIDQATSFAVNPDYGYLFYAAGSKVYQYDFSLGTTKLMVDKGGDEITLIKFQNFFANRDRFNELQRQLIVCSYDGTEGTMELYSVPPVNGQIELENTYTGFGKIKSVTYRER